MKDYCDICKNTRERYTSNPYKICKSCITKIPVGTILSLLDISYHSAIRREIEVPLTIKPGSFDQEIKDKDAWFWITIDFENKFCKCGVNLVNDLVYKIKLDAKEKKIILMALYPTGDRGLRDMNKLKQNYRRIKSCIKFWEY